MNVANRRLSSAFRLSNLIGFSFSWLVVPFFFLLECSCLVLLYFYRTFVQLVSSTFFGLLLLSSSCSLELPHCTRAKLSIFRRLSLFFVCTLGVLSACSKCRIVRTFLPLSMLRENSSILLRQSNCLPILFAYAPPISNFCLHFLINWVSFLSRWSPRVYPLGKNLDKKAGPNYNFFRQKLDYAYANLTGVDFFAANGRWL